MKTEHKPKRRPKKPLLSKESFYMATSTPPTIDPRPPSRPLRQPWKTHRQVPTRPASTRSASCFSATRCRTTIGVSRCSRTAFSKDCETWKRSRPAASEAWSPRSRSRWNRSPARCARSRTCAPRRTRNWDGAARADSGAGEALQPAFRPVGGPRA